VAPELVVPQVPALARWDRVELANAGTWEIAVGGEQTFTPDDFAAAVAALDCPAVGRPVIKLGHLDARGQGMVKPGIENRDGEPALGWVSNMGLANNRQTLVADLVGMPGWLGHIAASAYPSRSIEGCRNFTCQLGHQHPFVISAVALLGLTPPGVGTVGSLQDHVRALYGVAAASPDSSDPSGTAAPGGEPFVAVMFPAKEAPVPKRPELVAAAVTVDELRSAFHASSPWDYWITEIQLDPLQLIVCSDGGETFRVPVTIGADGDSFVFGAPVAVEITYVDETAPEPVAAAAKPLAVKFGSRAESRPGGRPAGWSPDAALTAAFAAAGEPPNDPTQTPSQGAPKPAGPVPQTDPQQDPVAPPSPATPQPPAQSPAPAQPAAEPEPTHNTQEGDDMSLSGVRSRLGLPDDADEAAVLAALDELKTKADTPAAQTPEPVAAAAKRDEQFAAAISQITTLSEELAAVKAEKAAEKKAAFFAAASQQGKISPADRPSWEERYDKAPDLIAEIIGAMAPGTAVPVAAAGYVGDPEPQVSDDDLLKAFFSPSDIAALSANDDSKVG
jgi:hypothetical protein